MVAEEASASLLVFVTLFNVVNAIVATLVASPMTVLVAAAEDKVVSISLPSEAALVVLEAVVAEEAHAMLSNVVNVIVVILAVSLMKPVAVEEVVEGSAEVVVEVYAMPSKRENVTAVLVADSLMRCLIKRYSKQHLIRH